MLGLCKNSNNTVINSLYDIISDNLKRDRDLILDLLSHGANISINKLHPTLLYDVKIAATIVNKNISCYNLLPLQTRKSFDVIKSAYENNYLHDSSIIDTLSASQVAQLMRTCTHVDVPQKYLKEFDVIISATIKRDKYPNVPAAITPQTFPEIARLATNQKSSFRYCRT